MGNRPVRSEPEIKYYKEVFLCYSYPRHKDFVIAENIPARAFHLDRTNIKDIKHLDYRITPKNSTLRVSTDVSTGIPLYYIQDGKFPNLATFEDAIITDPERNASDFVKLRREYLSDKIITVEVPRSFFRQKNHISLRNYLSSEYNITFPPEIRYIILTNLSKDNPLNTTHKFEDLVNDRLGITLKDIKPTLHRNYFVHDTNSFEETFESGELCNSGECDKKGYDPETGIYDLTVKLNPRETIPEMPGIYFTHLDPNLYNSPMNKHSLFHINKRADNFYGQIGFIYSLEYLFKNYRVNLKGDQGFGYGKEIDIEEYLKYNYSGEAIVRANEIPIKDIAALIIELHYSEIRFIYEQMRDVEDFTFGDVIKLYKKYRNMKWYIRKSNLTKVLRTYGKKLPLIILTRGEEYSIESSNYGTRFDRDSSDDLR